MDDVLDFLSARKPGRMPQPRGLEVTAELTLADLEAFRSPVKAEPVVKPLERVLAVHHMQARLLAEGRSAGEVAAIVGTSVQRLRLLQEDPAFQELLAYYKDQHDIISLDNREKANLVGRLAWDELQWRLEHEPEKISTNQVREIAFGATDRVDLPALANPLNQGQAPSEIKITFQIGNDLQAKQRAAKVIEGDGVEETGL